VTQNLATNGFLAVDVPDNYPEKIYETDVFTLSTTSNSSPTARSTFTLQPLEKYGGFGSTPLYGQKFYIVVNDALVEKPVGSIASFLVRTSHVN
jgi:hypothetical protein